MVDSLRFTADDDDDFGYEEEQIDVTTEVGEYGPEDEDDDELTKPVPEPAHTTLPAVSTPMSPAGEAPPQKKPVKKATAKSASAPAKPAPAAKAPAKKAAAPKPAPKPAPKGQQRKPR